MTEKAVAILGMSRTQSIANGFDRSDSVAVDNNNTSIGNSNSMVSLIGGGERRGGIGGINFM